jgi:hypothetical protein
MVIRPSPPTAHRPPTSLPGSSATRPRLPPGSASSAAWPRRREPERVTLGDPEKVAARIVVKGPEFTRAVTQAIAALEAVRDSGAE